MHAMWNKTQCLYNLYALIYNQIPLSSWVKNSKHKTPCCEVCDYWKWRGTQKGYTGWVKHCMTKSKTEPIKNSWIINKMSPLSSSSSLYSNTMSGNMEDSAANNQSQHMLHSKQSISDLVTYNPSVCTSETWSPCSLCRTLDILAP